LPALVVADDSKIQIKIIFNPPCDPAGVCGAGLIQQNYSISVTTRQKPECLFSPPDKYTPSGKYLLFIEAGNS
jgi:hypothetical protein